VGSKECDSEEYLGCFEKWGFSFNIKAATCGHAKNLTTGICLIFRGLNFEHNA
jgi:hypothetical protein